jgi:hypothetical protein
MGKGSGFSNDGWFFAGRFQEPGFQLDAGGASVNVLLKVSCKARPHPNLLPRGEGTAIACVSLRGCVSCESCRGGLLVQGSRRELVGGNLIPAFSPAAEPDRPSFYFGEFAGRHVSIFS